jgi:K+-transporting ATPase ATPase C chain
LRANLLLIGLTLVLCCVVYPLALWAIGQTVFPSQANGSLVYKDGKPVGSRLIAQSFTGAEYFQPRPSHAGGDSYDGTGYNAAASGASNWAASNPRLRARVARRLGPIVRYAKDPDPRKSKLHKGDLVGPDIEAWFQQDMFKGEKGVVALWAKNNPIMASEWAKSDKPSSDKYGPRGLKVQEWLDADWTKANPGKTKPAPEDAAVDFFAAYAAANQGAWPGVVETKNAKGEVEKKIEPIREGDEIRSYFFDLWLQEKDWLKEPIELEQIPADRVMASGSGLDPHLTLKNALSQLDGVAAAWATKSGKDKDRIRQKIEAFLNEHASAPLGGLAGAKLVNVVEINLALPETVARVKE